MYDLDMSAKPKLIVLDMTNFLTAVRLSMLSCRRTRPLPQDFLHSLHTHQLQLRTLLPHLDPPVPPSKSQFALDVESVDEKEQVLTRPDILWNGSDKKPDFYVPQHFPPFPSTHTYKATPVFPEREIDSRRIRERAMEEGRLGEQALRRLMGAASDQLAPARSQNGRSTNSMRAKRDELWKETMLAMASEAENTIDNSGDLQVAAIQQKPEGQNEKALTKTNFGKHDKTHLSSAVNADKRYWRHPAT